MSASDTPTIVARLRALWARFRRSPRFAPVALAGLFMAFGALGVAWGSWQNLCATCPSVARIRTWEPEQTSKLLAHDGRPLAELGFRRRTPVSINALPDYVPRAVVAIEDKRFYEHGGFDLRGIARAVVGRVVRRLTGANWGGGSTITQQLARNMFEESIGFEVRYTRKLRELQVALELERSYTKDEILEAYINEIYMGRGYGFQSASRAYFGKDVRDVNVAEAALLAAILNRPGAYDPFTEPENALRRRNLVLERMTEQGYLSRAEADEWKAHPLPAEDHSGDSLYGIAPYFEEWVRQILDSRFGDEVYRGGLRVYTTLDLDMQRAANEAMDWGWNRIEDLPNFLHPSYEEFDTVQAFGSETPYLQGMFVALDPHTGAVRALIGGRDFEQSKFDRARLAQRQAGSSFKPFVYGAAIASGIPASHIVVDQPVVYEQGPGLDLWRPSNFEPEFQGPLTLRDALRQSINMVAIKLGWEEVGIRTVIQTARRMGIRTEIEPYPSSTIGAAEVIPLEMAEAYSAFATLGTSVRPFPILRVESAEGEVLWEPQPERTQVMDSLPARIMVDLLQTAANLGTGGNHRTVGGLPAEVPTAGKTGTTNDGTNTWFIGFTPNLQAAVWFGMDRPVPMARGASQQATGGYYAAPVWGRFMKHVYYGYQPPEPEEGENGEAAMVEAPEPIEASLPIPEPWPILPGLTTRQVDRKSGKLWSRWCSEEDRYTEYYIPGTEPTEVCDNSGFRIPRMRGGGR